MVALIGGIAALVLGLIGIVSWWSNFIDLLKGSLPALLILAGALAAYLGTEELKDKRRAELEAAREPFTPEQDDVERYKQEVAELKAKLEALEKQQEPPAPPKAANKEKAEKKEAG